MGFGAMAAPPVVRLFGGGCLRDVPCDEPLYREIVEDVKQLLF